MTPPAPRDEPGAPEHRSGVRLQKALAAAGVASRRASEELIAAGRVDVNGEPARLGMRVDPVRDVIRLDGQRLVVNPAQAYLALNKPLGVVSAMLDRRGRPVVGDLVPPELYVRHVGRLDADTGGLLLLTSDGELAHRLTHPSYRVPKLYLAEVAGRMLGSDLRRLQRGVDLDDGPAAADAARSLQYAEGRSLVEVTLHEGRNRIVRRMFEALDHPVVQLTRLAIGPVRLGELRPGRWRHLHRQEVESLMRLVDM